MSAITIVSATICIAVALLPALAELARVRSERTNPIRRLRVPTRRHQVVDLSASGSFA